MSAQSPDPKRLMPSDEFRAVVDRINTLIDPSAFADIGKSKLAMVAPSQAAIKHLGEILKPISATFNGQFAEIMTTASSALKSIATLVPVEWRDLNEDETDAAIALAVDHGIATIWVPRVEVIRALIEAAPGGRMTALFENEGLVLDDIAAAIDAVPDDSLGDWPRLCLRSLAAHQAGHVEASQALSAALLTTMIHELVGRRLAKARRDFARSHPDEVALRRFRLTVVFRAVAISLAEADGNEKRFNRHTSIHHASLSQYSAENSLAALMLVTNFMRELHDFESRLQAAGRSFRAA